MDKIPHNIQASDHQLAEIVQGMNEACFALDSNWRFSFVNDRCQTLLHHGRDEMLGRSIWELFHELDGTPVEEQCRRAMTERVPVSYETFSPIAGRWIDVRVFPSGDGLAVFLLDIHERKLAERALEDASRLNRQIVSGAREGIIVYGSDLRYQVWNPFMEELTGYSAAEVIGRHPLEVFPFLKESGVMDQLERVLAGESCAIREFPFHVTRSGRSGWASDTNSPLRNGNGGIIGVIGIVTDITGRKLADQALRESETRFRQLIHSLPAAVYTCDAEGRITLYNAAAVKLWGRGPKSGDRWGCAHRLHTPDGKRVFRRNSPIATAVRDGKPMRDCELIVERQDGGRSHVMAFPEPILDSSGAVVGAVNMLVDITALKAVENSLHTSERTLRKLSRAVEQSPSSIVITSPTGEIDYVNPKFTELTGYSVDEVLGKNPRVLKSGHQPPEFYADMWATILAGRDWRGEICNRKKNGELYWEFAVIAPILDEAGKVTHFVALKEDITERKRSEAALRESERSERERAAELAALLDAVPTPVFISHDPDCTHIVGNCAADELLHIPRGGEASLSAPEGTRPRHFRAVKDGRDLNNDELPVQRAARGLPVHGMEFSFVFDDGTSRDLLSYGTTLWDEDGRPRGAVAVLIDITERKRLEREILEISECEQSRLGQDLHDGLGQELAGIAMLCKVLADELQKGAHPSSKSAADISTYVNNAISSARLLARGLYPVNLRRYGLCVALGELAGQTGSRLGIRCELRQTGVAPEFGESVVIHIYRIVQECIGNAIKHGHARCILIESLAGDGFHTFTVTDDGTGFEKPVENGGMGLHLMEYRARVIDAKITVEKPGQGGCRVTCTVPV